MDGTDSEHVGVCGWAVAVGSGGCKNKKEKQQEARREGGREGGRAYLGFQQLEWEMYSRRKARCVRKTGQIINAKGMCECFNEVASLSIDFLFLSS